MFELWECVLDTFAALASLLMTKSGAVLVSGLRLLSSPGLVICLDLASAFAFATL